MTLDPGFEPWPGKAYDSAAQPPSALSAPSPVLHRPTRGVVVAGGVAIALALGLAVGFLARPELDDGAAQAKPMAPAPPGAQQGLTIQPGAVQAMGAVRPAGKLEVLPPDLIARASPAPASASAPAAVRDVSDVVADPTPPTRADPRQFAAEEPCSGDAGRAAQMVCSDPDLSAADRALNRAYRRAMRAGAIPPDQLRADQQEWLSIREDAARRSPGALARVYDQRIDELNQLAEDGPG